MIVYITILLFVVRSLALRFNIRGNYIMNKTLYIELTKTQRETFRNNMNILYSIIDINGVDSWDLTNKKLIIKVSDKASPKELLKKLHKKIMYIGG